MNLTYVCTDSDCAQYRAKISDTEYSLIEYRRYPDSYVVCQAWVDINDCSLDELETYVSPYYGSLDRMVADYGLRGSMPVIAECIFEQFGPSDMEFNLEFETEQDARNYIECWIKSKYERR